MSAPSPPLSPPACHRAVAGSFTATTTAFTTSSPESSPGALCERHSATGHHKTLYSFQASNVSNAKLSTLTGAASTRGGVPETTFTSARTPGPSPLQTPSAVPAFDSGIRAGSGDGVEAPLHAAPLNDTDNSPRGETTHPATQWTGRSTTARIPSDAVSGSLDNKRESGSTADARERMDAHAGAVAALSVTEFDARTAVALVEASARARLRQAEVSSYLWCCRRERAAAVAMRPPRLTLLNLERAHVAREVAAREARAAHQHAVAMAEIAHAVPPRSMSMMSRLSGENVAAYAMMAPAMGVDTDAASSVSAPALPPLPGSRGDGSGAAGESSLKAPRASRQPLEWVMNAEVARRVAVRQFVAASVATPGAKFFPDMGL